MSQKIGLEYIAKIYNIEYKEIAEKIGVSQPTIQDWLKGRRKIPEKRLEQLAECFKLDKKYFQKELTTSEELELQIEYWHKKNAKDAQEYTDYIYDPNDDKEYEVPKVYYPYNDVIGHLNTQLHKETLVKSIDSLIHKDDEVDPTKYYVESKGDFNAAIVDRVVTVLSTGAEKEINALNTLLIILTEYGFGLPNPSEVLEKGLFKDMLIALKKNGIE